VISPGEKSRLRFCCAKNMFLRVSGTLRNPPGTTTKTTMPRTPKPGTRRIEFNINMESLKRLHELKKLSNFRNQDELLEALIYQASENEQIDPNISDRLEQKIDYLIETLDFLTE